VLLFPLVNRQVLVRNHPGHAGVGSQRRIVAVLVDELLHGWQAGGTVYGTLRAGAHRRRLRWE
jgi:hypothetical protein